MFSLLFYESKILNYEPVPYCVISIGTSIYDRTAKTKHDVFDLALEVLYMQTVYIFSSGLLITCLSSQSAGTTQAVQGSVGRESPDLARGAWINAEVGEKYSHPEK